jgi:hypothetical protein
MAIQHLEEIHLLLIKTPIRLRAPLRLAARAETDGKGYDKEGQVFFARAAIT